MTKEYEIRLTKEEIEAVKWALYYQFDMCADCETQDAFNKSIVKLIDEQMENRE